jgi:hypothetical protein
MRNEMKIFLLGIATGAILGAFARDISLMDKVLRYDRAIQDCEENLPRKQHCRVVGLPISVD